MTQVETIIRLALSGITSSDTKGLNITFEDFFIRVEYEANPKGYFFEIRHSGNGFSEEGDWFVMAFPVSGRFFQKIEPHLILEVFYSWLNAEDSPHLEYPKDP